MATACAWKLKRYGRFESGTGERRKHWKTFESDDKHPQIVITIVESGHLLVLQGHNSLDTIPLLCGSDVLKVQQKSDNLMFRFALKGEVRMMRMQFDGSSGAEAINECSSAVEKLLEYMPVTTQDDTPRPPNQSPAEASAQVTQGKAAEVTPQVVQGSVSIKRLTQHYLGGTTVTLPRMYYHGSLTEDDLKPILQICLLDPSFPAFVEKVEGELRKLSEE